MYGAIEAGGTKFVCAVSDENLKISKQVTISTTTPTETFKKVFEFFDQYELLAIGVGSFGPIDVDESSSTYGHIMNTAKTKWRNTDFVGKMKERYQVPIGWDTDVNAAALGEYTCGAGQNKMSCVYVTVGTGIGGGAIFNGKSLQGYSHPEMGHFYVPRHPKDKYPGTCAVHGDCLEGLAAGPSIKKRYGKSGKELSTDHEVWDIISYYLAHAALIYTMTLRPDCIIFGGGVMKQKHLFKLIRTKFTKLLNNYIDVPSLDEYIISPDLGSDSGIIGSLLLAKHAIKK